MHAITVLTAYDGPGTFRFAVHPEPNNSFPASEPLEPNAHTQKVTLHKDSQGMLQARKRPWTFAFDPPTGIFRLAHQQREVLSGSVQTGKFQPPMLFFRQQPHDSIHGFGTGAGRLVLNQSWLRLLNTDTRISSIPGHSYSSFPFFWIRRDGRFIAVYVNVTYPSDVSILNEEDSDLGPGITFRYLQTEPITMDVFTFVGTPTEISESYSRLTGRPFLPPAWSLGFHQSRWSYRSTQRVQEVADRFRKEDVPCDAIHLDIHHMDRYRSFTWSSKSFTNPQAMHEHLTDIGMRTVAIVDPGIAVADDYPVYARALQADVFCKRSDGHPYVGRVWPGPTAFPDFTQAHARDWWADEHKSLFAAGVSGIWNDMNEPVLQLGRRYDPLREDIHHAGAPHAGLRNLYANYEAQATNDAFSKHLPNTRPFVLTRGATCGIQKYAALWTGDNISSWDHLRENLSMVLNLGLSGVPFCGADVGGFAGRAGRLGIFKLRPARELFVRWVQLGALLPFFRAHTVLYSPDQEPWNFGEAALAIIRRHIKRRYRLLPYLYGLFEESSRTGLPIVRPVFYHHPDAPPEASHDQFLIGEALMAAPVLTRGTRERMVYLPQGEWFNYDSGERFGGGAQHLVAADLNTLPLFVRGGTVLPVCRAAHNAESSLHGETGFEVFGTRDLKGRLYIDDARSLSYRAGQSCTLEVSGKTDRQGGLTLHFSGKPKKYKPPFEELFVRLPGEFQSMRLRGNTVAARTEELTFEDRTRIVSRFRVPIGATRAEFK